MNSGYLYLFIVGMLATEPWRWAGVFLSQGLSVDGEIMRWVKSVSTALVAGLISRLVIFPIGELANVALEVRLISFLCGTLAYLALGRSLAIGITTGIGTLILLS
jgi:branched-subunit amino acid transport protein